MRVKVERLKSADWEEFHRCFKQILEEEFLGYPRKARESFSDEARLKNAFKKKKRFFWVAKLERSLSRLDFG